MTGVPWRDKAGITHAWWVTNVEWWKENHHACMTCLTREGKKPMSRIADFIDIELQQCLEKVSGMLAFSENLIHKVGQDSQADEDDKKAYAQALVRIQRVRNGLHG